jgi:hypothetical protein
MRFLRSARRHGARVAMLAVLCGSLYVGSSTTASASVPPPDTGCTAATTALKSGTTLTFHLWGYDCNVPGTELPMWAVIYLHAQRGSTTLHDATLRCPLNFTQVKACVAKGMSWSTTDPAGTQNYQYGGSINFYNNLGVFMFTKWATGSANF